MASAERTASPRSVHNQKVNTVMAKRSSRRSRGRVSGSLAALSLADLQAELGRRQGALAARAAELEAELEEIRASMGAISGVYTAVGAVSRAPASRVAKSTVRRGRRGTLGLTAAGKVRRRPKNDMNLVEALVRVLTGRTMSVTEVTQAVQDAGYQTSSANFRTIVNQTLIKSKAFKKVSRGKYTAA